MREKKIKRKEHPREIKWLGQASKQYALQRTQISRTLLKFSFHTYIKMCYFFYKHSFTCLSCLDKCPGQQSNDGYFSLFVVEEISFKLGTRLMMAKLASK